MDLTRRGIVSGAALGAMAGAAVAIQAPPTFASETATAGRRVPFDPTDISQGARAFLKMVGSLGDETVRRWFTGKIYAYFPGEPVQELFYMDGFYLGDFWRQDDGTHRSTLFEIAIKRDLETGRLLEKFKNPFTGRTDDVMQTVGGPQERLYNEWGFDRPTRPRGPDNPRVFDWMIFGDDVWFTWDAFLRFRNPVQPDEHPLASSGENLNLVNLTNYKGSLSHLEDPDILNAPGTLIWNAITEWQPWMRMGQRPGALIYKAIGVKVQDFGDLPKPIFEATEAAFPGCLTEQRDWPTGNYVWADYVGADWEE